MTKKYWGPFLYSARTAEAESLTPSETVYCGSFFTLTKDRVDAFFLGKRPENLRGGNAPTARDQRGLKVFHERQERSPLLIARHFLECIEQSGAKSIRRFCRDEGKDWSVVSRHLRMLRLPDEIIGFLEQNQTPEVLRHFTVKRLDALARLPGDEATSSFMQEVSKLGLCSAEPRS